MVNEPEIAALDGLGLVLLPSAVISAELEARQLQPVLMDIVGATIPVSLVFADREFIDPKVREFVDRALQPIAKETPKPFNFELSE